MTNEKRAKIILIGLFTVTMGLLAVAVSWRNDRLAAVQRVEFADYSVDLEVDAVNEAERINVGAFKPFLAGDLTGDLKEELPADELGSDELR